MWFLEKIKETELVDLAFAVCMLTISFALTLFIVTFCIDVLFNKEKSND